MFTRRSVVGFSYDSGAQLGEEARFFDGALKATQSNFEGFVFAEFDDHELDTQLRV